MHGIGIMRLLMRCVVLSSAIWTSGCATIKIEGSATSDEICRQLGAGLPTRSVDDTPQTIDEITKLYALYSIVCPDWEHLIP